MKKYLAITAAVALALTACGQTAADSTPTLTAATETTQATAAPAEPPQGIGSGALRMLTAAADGVYYQAFNDWEINYTDTMGRALVYAIDEETGDARPVCSLPGCAHDSAACPAWSNGNVTLCYGDGDEVYLLLFYYNDETSYYRWERISADHTQRTVLATIEPGQSVVGRGVAVDDVNLYYSLLDEDNRHQTLWAVDTAGGQMQRNLHMGRPGRRNRGVLPRNVHAIGSQRPADDLCQDGTDERRLDEGHAGLRREPN